MHPAGIAEVERARADGRWAASQEVLPLESETTSL
jgi:hypothetical protein